MQIHILGTSSSRPAHGRSVSGSIINTNKGAIIVDCGEGFQERINNHNKNVNLKYHTTLNNHYIYNNKLI